MFRSVLTHSAKVLPEIKAQRLRTRITLTRLKSTATSTNPSIEHDESNHEKNLDKLVENEDITLEDIEKFEDLMEKEFQGSFKASTTEPQKLAESEVEMFGMESASAEKAQTTKLDPQSLPRRVTLEELGPNFTEEDYASTLVHGRGIHLPYFHPRTHDIPVANIQFRSHQPRLLELFTHFATHAASSLGIPTSRVFALPTQRSLWTVPRSPFVHKKSQENFERRVYKRAIKAWDADPEVVDRWAKYLVRHQMGGVGMRITKWERMPIGVGQTRFAQVKDALEVPESVDSGSIKDLGKKIIIEEMKGIRGQPRKQITQVS